MRADGSTSQTSVGRFDAARLDTALRRRGLGRPLAAGLALVTIGGVLTMASALLDRGATAPSASRHGWPTAVAGDLADPAFAPVLVPARHAETLSDQDLEATLARLEKGDFGVVFEALPADAMPAASSETAIPLAPVVSIDAARPPLRLDIMGLGIVRPGSASVERQRRPMPETVP